MKKSLLEGIKNNPWFTPLSKSHLKKLVSITSQVHWPAGKVIFREGEEEGQHLYLVMEGRVALEIYFPARGRVTILTLGDNDLFGWSSVLPAVDIKTATARAILDTHAIAINARALRKMCDQDHELGHIVYRALANIIANRLTATRLQLLDIYAATPTGEE